MKFEIMGWPKPVNDILEAVLGPAAGKNVKRYA